MNYNPPGTTVRGISQQGYWSGSLFTSPGNLPSPGIKPASPALAGGLFIPEPPGKARPLPAPPRRLPAPWH